MTTRTRYEVEYDRVWEMWRIIDLNCEGNLFTEAQQTVAVCDSVEDANLITKCLLALEYDRKI